MTLNNFVGFRKLNPTYILLLLLSGCTTMAPTTTPITTPYSEKRIQAIQSWTVNGAIGVIAGTQGGNASLNWRQYSRDSYQLALFGPLGLNRVELTGTPTHAILTSGGKTYTAPNAETLLAQQLGWPVPVSHLFYWVRGLPVPNFPSRIIRQANGSPAQIHQGEWSVQYLGYESVRQMYLPQRISITHPRLKVRLVIKQWQIP